MACWNVLLLLSISSSYVSIVVNAQVYIIPDFGFPKEGTTLFTYQWCFIGAKNGCNKRNMHLLYLLRPYLPIKSH